MENFGNEVRIPSFFSNTAVAADAAPDISERIHDVQDKVGFLPNIFATLSWHPDEFRAFFAYHDALMESREGLSKAEREMIVVATSAQNHCLYCVVAHGAILRIRAKNPSLSETVALDFERADITEREKTILRFAHKVAFHSQLIDHSDFPPLYNEGLSDQEIWQIGAITAFFAMSNRLAGFAKILPNAEFHLMGRGQL